MKIKLNLIFLKDLLKPSSVIGVIVIIALLSVVLTQHKLKERIFKKPAVEKAQGVAGTKTEMPQEPILVKVYKTQKKNFDDNLPLLGNIKGFKEIDLKFEANGILDSFNFKEGERVEEGDIIGTIDQKDALLKLRYNEIELKKTQNLFDIGAITELKLEQAKLEFESAKRELDKTYLYAPVSGILGTKDAEVGELVTSNDKIGTLIDDKEVFVELGIVEKDVGRVKIGQKGKVIVDTYPDTEFEGIVDTISPVIEGKSRTQTAKLKIKNPKALLLPGMFARSSVSVYSDTDVIVIPNAAIDKTEDGYVTYVVRVNNAEKPAETKDAVKKEEVKEESAEEEGVIEAKPIKADYRSADFFVIKSGLEEGELVVVETQEKLKDGNKVIITEVQEAIF